MNPPARGVRVRQARRSTADASAALQRAQQLTERLLAFAADQKIHVVARLVRRWREARIVPASDNACRRPKVLDEPRDLEGGCPLKRHDRQADDIGLVLAHQPLDGGDDLGLDQDEVGDRDAMMRIEVAGQRRERAVGHPDHDRRHVLEGIRHREQEHIHIDVSILPLGVLV